MGVLRLLSVEKELPRCAEEAEEALCKVMKTGETESVFRHALKLTHTNQPDHQILSPISIHLGYLRLQINNMYENERLPGIYSYHNLSLISLALKRRTSCQTEYWRLR